nr:immunoglobulin heavy chain junction region [Macaca mulatta]MOX62917.1 immunoglobulin heavy chain junction region [Macaca mulatta]
CARHGGSYYSKW